MRDEDLTFGVEAVRILCDVIGPRPPASAEEAAAAAYVARELTGMGLEPDVEEFRSSRSFGPGYALTFGLAAFSGLLKRGILRYTGAVVSTALGLAESRFSRAGTSAVLKWRRSRNVLAAIEPSGNPERTVCLVSHLDSSRSGLMFDPRVTPALGRLVAAMGLALIIQALDPLIGRGPGRWLIGIARALCAVSLGLVLEREIRGENVAGANDNASGVGACLALASRFSRSRLDSTRVVVLVTGSEESGVHGMRHMLAAHDTADWLFVNFDGVSAAASLRVLSKEGGPLGAVDADPELLGLAAEVGAETPELEAALLEHGSGLPYDSTPVLAGGGRAITVVNQDGAIPDYHWPTDRFGRISRPAFERAIRFGEALLLKLDRP